MKKYERVNLTSDIYRDKQQSKHQLNPKALQFSNQDTNRKNQTNICCPSCKYLFKIPKQKQNERSKSPMSKTSKQDQTLKKKWQDHIIRPNDKYVQTQPIVMSPVKSSPKRERFNVESNRKSNPNTDRTPERVPYFDIKSVQQENPSSYTDRKSKQNIQPLFIPQKKQVANKSNQKIQNLIVKSKSKTKETFPVRSAYMNSTQPVNNHISNRQQQSRNHSPSFKKNDQIKSQINLLGNEVKNQPRELTEMNSKLAKQLVQKIELTQQINQIIQYHLNLPVELSVPSYCKMLIYNMQERKVNERNLQKQQEDKKHFQGQFYNARFSQLRSKYQKNKEENPKY